MSRWPLKPIGDLCEVNPRLPRGHDIPDGLIVSFVPMAAVDEVSGTIQAPQTRPFGEVKKGYTHFRNGDVLFAKITPCMENGKAAIASELAGGIGFGSTEFHVLRAKDEVLPEWLFYFVRQPTFRNEAKRNFTGTAGQQRVPTTFLSSAAIPVPPLSEQRRIVDLLSRAEGIVHLRREGEKKAAELIPALFLDMFGDPATNPKGWPTASIGDLFEVKGGKRLPKGAPYAEKPTAFRYIRGTDIWPDQINTQNLVYLRPEDQATIKRYVVAKDDVVITIAGKIGVAAPVGDDLVGVNLTENAAMIRPHGTKSTNAAFLSSMLNSGFVQRQIETLTGRVTIGKLALERIRLLKILLPALGPQAEYVQRVEQIRAIQSQQSSATAKAQATFDALLARVFKTPSTNY